MIKYVGLQPGNSGTKSHCTVHKVMNTFDDFDTVEKIMTIMRVVTVNDDDKVSRCCDSSDKEEVDLGKTVR